MSDNLWLALLVLVAGLAVGFVAKFASGRWLPQWRLYSARDGLEKRYQEAQANLTSTVYQRPSAADVAEFVKKNKDAVRAYAKTTVMFDDTAAALVAARDAVASAITDAGVLGSTGDDGLGHKLDQLDSKVHDFADYIHEHFPDSAEPAVAKKAAGILHPAAAPVALPVGGATKLIADIAAVSDLIDRWMAWGEDIRRYTVWAAVLREAIDAAPGSRAKGTPLAADIELLRDASGRLLEAHFEMVDVVDAAAVDATHLAGDLDEVYAALARLSGRYGVYVPRDWEVQEAAAQPLRYLAAVADLVAPSTTAFADVQALLGRWVENLVPRDVGANIEHVIAHGARDVAAIVLEFLVLLAAGGFTFLVAFRTSYAGKAFGSFSDYLTVFGEGLGAAVVIGGVTAAMQAWLPPRLSTEKKAATTTS